MQWLQEKGLSPFRSISDNHLKGSLPGEVAAILPPGSSIETVVSGEYISVGIGTTVQHGEPGAIVSTSVRPNYLVDAWVGWEWPSNRSTYGLRLGVGMPVFGRDELSISTYYTNTQGGTAGQAFKGLEIRYNLRLGR